MTLEETQVTKTVTMTVEIQDNRDSKYVYTGRWRSFCLLDEIFRD